MIQTLDDLIPAKTLGSCQRWLDRAQWKHGWNSNNTIPYGHWNTDITKTSHTNPTDTAYKLPPEFRKVWELLNARFFNNSGWLTRCYANRHTFGTEGFIHTDSERPEDQTVVVYLNPEWKAIWGGETTFYSRDHSEILKAVLPHPGRVAVFPGNVPHCARALTRICPEVRTTLMFKVTCDPKPMFASETGLRTFLEAVGAHKQPHKHGSLMDHLMRCYHILKNAGFGDSVALAAGLHSVYGTKTRDKPCLTWENTAVEDHFGSDVDVLVRLFATLERPRVLETGEVDLPGELLFLLRCIECVNLHDQDELTPDKYPNLCAFAGDLKKQRISYGQ